MATPANAWEQGFYAASFGETMDDNPYTKGFIKTNDSTVHWKYLRWCEGWIAFQKENEPEELDGKYRIKNKLFTFQGGYKESFWTIVNIHGEICKKNGKQLKFGAEKSAKKYCDKLNICPDGAVLTNMD